MLPCNVNFKCSVRRPHSFHIHRSITANTCDAVSFLPYVVFPVIDISNFLKMRVAQQFKTKIENISPQFQVT